jgi:hypothetical protein
MIVRVGGVSVELVVREGRAGIRADRVMRGLGDRLSRFMTNGARRDLTLAVTPVVSAPWGEILAGDDLTRATRIARAIEGRFPFTGVPFGNDRGKRRDGDGSSASGKTTFGLLSGFDAGEVSVIPQPGLLLGVDHARGYGEALIRGEDEDDLVASLTNALQAAVSLWAPQRGGVMLHASSVVIDGGGYAFVGGSGAGKSTVVGSVRPDKILSDDGSFCSHADGVFYLSPTPFSRMEAGSGGADRAPLKKVLFLEKDIDDYITDYSRGRAMTTILLNHIHFFRYMCGRSALLTFDIIGRLCGCVPVHSLHFTRQFDPVSFFGGSAHEK